MFVINLFGLNIYKQRYNFKKVLCIFFKNLIMGESAGGIFILFNQRIESLKNVFNSLTFNIIFRN